MHNSTAGFTPNQRQSGVRDSQGPAPTHGLQIGGGAPLAPRASRRGALRHTPSKIVCTTPRAP
ncbi:hypothetical protein N658DRAFT_491259 [Parathielavia hyrcaniae]|uniref:Uncharacterized protein n=1 Tax=Parathielavia hyrcaniae TaxID=113614 RepID=A0AAN6QAJ1_9PEZI|nr:hypothetical protein N658DRAFT_491259 [Parathielavia hyrcaniae]